MNFIKEVQYARRNYQISSTPFLYLYLQCNALYYKFNYNGGLVAVGENVDFEKAKGFILNSPELFNSSGNCIKNRPFISCADISKGFKIIHADGKAVGFAIAQAYMQRNINENVLWEVYMHTTCGPKHLGKAETKTQIINLIGSEDELVDGNGDRI